MAIAAVAIVVLVVIALVAVLIFTGGNIFGQSNNRNNAPATSAPATSAPPTLPVPTLPASSFAPTYSVGYGEASTFALT